MKHKIFTGSLWVIILLFMHLHAEAQFTKINSSDRDSAERARDMAERMRNDKGIRIMFYNLENLFFPTNDSLTADDEYTPEGMRGWTYKKLQRKCNNLYKAIISIGGWEAPEIIGVCEVENRAALNALMNETPLGKLGYKIVHRDSPDPRGIDVAMLYRRDKVQLLGSKTIPVRFSFDTTSRTRDILLTKMLVLDRDTLYLFVNHWPSRFGGYANTIEKRNATARILKSSIDSIRLINPNAKIIAMGDFNDEATDMSIAQVLGATLDSTNVPASGLYNMMGGAGLSWNRGTIKSREVWMTIDQFIVTPALINAQSGLRTTYHGARIFDPPFLLEKDEAWFGMKPFRTYYGAKYIGGFSDHLPIYMDVYFEPFK